KHIPTGLDVHCIEMTPGKGGALCRAAGMAARLTNKEGRMATLVLPSGEIRQVLLECRATIGAVGNADNGNIILGKAGRARWLGRRPRTRGVAMSHHQHPHGGARQGHDRNIAGRGVRKGGRIFFMLCRKRGPELKAVAVAAHVPQVIGGALGMHDATARGHPIDGAGFNALHHAGRVTVHHGAFKQVSHRRQPDVGMRAHIMVVARVGSHRAEVVKKHKGAYGLALHGGQNAAHGETATQVMGTGNDGSGHRLP
ncbi:MAG: hypothetical protein EBR49_17795, partial [Betaproteobacteria bacterium]|nr:hypothetical protein [Betaproteobacteria bacterium]